MFQKLNEVPDLPGMWLKFFKNILSKYIWIFGWGNVSKTLRECATWKLCLILQFIVVHTDNFNCLIIVETTYILLSFLGLNVKSETWCF